MTRTRLVYTSLSPLLLFGKSVTFKEGPRLIFQMFSNCVCRNNLQNVDLPWILGGW